MTGTQKAAGKHRLVPQNVIAALAVLVVGVATFALAMRLQQFAGNLYAGAALFVFPLPVACGLVFGFTAPRGSLVWSVVWACILSALVFAVASWSIGGIPSLTSPWRFVPGVIGVIIAAFAAILGETAVTRAFVRRATGLFIVLCAVTLAAGASVARREARVYEGTLLPRVLLELESDYLDVPSNVHWDCRMRRDLSCYELTGVIGEKRIVVFADADSPKVLGIRYRVNGAGPVRGGVGSAQTYLMKLGFRPGIVRSLSARPHSRGPWTGGLNFTRLTLAPNGSVTLEPYPPFESRAGRQRHVRQSP